MLIWEVRLKKAKRINFPVTASTTQTRAWHSPQKAAAGPATAASRRRARSQAEVRILCILSTECWGWGEAEVRTVSASWPAHPATQQHRWLVAILLLILRTPQCPNCPTQPMLIDTTDRPPRLSVNGGYVGLRLEIEDLITINPFYSIVLKMV